MSLTAEQRKLLRREGLATADADRVRSHADRLDDPEKAEALREVAFDLEAEDEPAGATDDSSSGSDPKASRTPAGSKPNRSGRTSKRRRSATGQALRDAAREPDRQVAGAIRTTSSAFWSAALGAVFLVVVYLLLTKGPRSVAAIRELEHAARWVVFPPAVFPDRHVPNRKATP